MSETSPADIAAVMRDNDGLGGNSGVWAIVLIIIAAMFGGLNNRTNESAVTEADLCNVNNFNELQSSVGRLSDSVSTNARTTDNAFSTLGYTMQTLVSGIKSDIADLGTAMTAQVQGVKDMIQQNKIESLQSRISQLELQSATAGIPRYPNGFTYNAGSNPFCSCGTACGTAF